MKDAIISSNTEPYSSSSASASNVSYYKKSLKNLSVDQQIRAAEQKIKNDPLKPRRIHIFIGIKKYSALNDSDLTYSAKDASDLYSCFYYNEDDDIVFLLTDGKATLRNIKKVQEWTKENSKNKENNIMLFFSGHGYIYEEESKVESERHAYLIPQDGDIDKPDTLISMEYLIPTLKDTKGRKLVILDACHSGRFIGKTVTMDELVKTPAAKGVKGLSVAELKKMLGDAKDIFWLNASRGDQIARELKEEENGILTACLKRAFKYGTRIGEADLSGNKDITEVELASYAIYAVPCVTYKSMIIKEQLGTLEEIYEYFLKPAIKKLKRKTNISEKTREQLEYYDKIIAGNANKRFIMKTALNIVFESAYHYNDIYNRYVEPLIKRAKKKAQENGITIQIPTYIDSYKVSDDYQKDLIIKVAPLIDGKQIDQFELQRFLDEIAEEAYRERLKHGGNEIGPSEPSVVELEKSGADIHKEFEVFKKKIITFYIKEGIGKKDKPKPADYNQDGQVTKEEVARYVISKATTMLDKWIVKKLAEKKGKAYEKYSDEEKEKARVEAAKFDIDSKIDPDEVIIILFELTHD